MSLADLVGFMGRKGVLHHSFYHFTDERNLPSIRQHGLLSMAQIRRDEIVVAAPGGNEWSWDADRLVGMDRYVHLAFFDSHPMEYRAKQEGRINNTRFLKIRPEIVLFDGVRVSLEVSNKAGAVIKPIAEALDDIDFEVIYTRTDWKDDGIKQRLKAAKLCELLVPDHIPINQILNLD